MNIIITGSNGWLGSSILKNINFLLKGENYTRIILLGQKDGFFETDDFFGKDQQKLKEKCFKLFINIQNFEEILKIDDFLNRKLPIKVIHTAGIIHPNKIKDFIRINFQGTKNIYRYCESRKLEKFVYVSSNSPFGFNLNNVAFNEDSKYKPVGLYGYSKMMAEKFLLNQQNQEVIKIIRAPWFHGVGMPNRQKKFLKNVVKGFFPIVHTGANKRSIINVNDLSLACINILNSKKLSSNIYWVCDEPTITMNQYLNKIKNAATRLSLKPVNNLIQIKLPPGTSFLFSRLDIFLQRFGIYSMYIHILGELGMDIFANSKKYRDEFPEHIFKTLDESLEDEVREIC